MNEDQYHALCKACDALLREPNSGVERIATPWLHVIRAHPIFLENYAEIFSLQLEASWSRQLRNFVSSWRHLIKAAAGNGVPWSNVGELPQKCDVLIVSHLVNESFPGQEGDFYFGRAAGELAELGISSAIALINYTGTAPAILASSWRQAKIPRVILSPVLTMSAEWSLFRRARAEARRLRGCVTSPSNDLNHRVTARAAVEAASGGTISALRVGEQINALVKRLQPNAIVLTYEGHSWERIAFAAARAASPGIRCIGYQHAALFNLQHAVQRKLADDYNPDAILTPGRVSQLRLQKNPQLENVRIETLGSNRSFARQPAHAGVATNGDKHACLVLPEGIVGECNLLFGFALECARTMPDIEFIWRLHPNMNYEMLKKQNRAFRQLPSNVILSKSNLKDDISRSRWALYRGSTAIVQAAVSGLTPIYLHQTGEIPIDTLYEIEHLHAKVSHPNDFKALVTGPEGTDAGAKAQQIQDYCEQMFTPINTSVLAGCIAKTW